MERAAVLARVAAIAMVKELDGGDWDEEQENLASRIVQDWEKKEREPKVYTGGPSPRTPKFEDEGGF